MSSVAPPRSFFDPSTGRRLAAAKHAHPEADHFALRELALGDEDARVRLAALERLAEGSAPEVLLQATGDEAPSVRQAAWAALRAKTPDLVERAQVALEVASMGIWRIAALAVAGGWYATIRKMQAVGARPAGAAAGGAQPVVPG